MLARPGPMFSSVIPPRAVISVVEPKRWSMVASGPKVSAPTPMAPCSHSHLVEVAGGVGGVQDLLFAVGAPGEEGRVAAQGRPQEALPGACRVPGIDLGVAARDAARRRRARLPPGPGANRRVHAEDEAGYHAN